MSSRIIGRAVTPEALHAVIEDGGLAMGRDNKTSSTPGQHPVGPVRRVS
jgi:hypothetical protein